MKPFPVTCPNCQKRVVVKRPELIGKRVRCPGCQTPFKIQSPTPPQEPDPPEPIAEEPPAIVTDAPIIVDEEQPHVRTDRKRLVGARKRKKKQQRWNWSIIGVLTMMALVVVGFVLSQYSPARQKQVAKSAPVVSPPEKTELAEPLIVETPEPQVKPRVPFTLEYIPAGTKLIAHWHPKKLSTWGEEPGELWQCGGLFTEWLETFTERLCAIDLKQVDQLTFYLIPGIKGTPPACIAKFKLSPSLSQAQWRTQHQGEKRQLHGQVALAQDGRVWYWLDNDLCLSVPEELLEESLRVGRSPEPTTSGIDRLVEKTDIGSEVTFLGDLRVLQTGTKEWLSGAQSQVLIPLVEWFGPDIETVLWELQLDNQLVSNFTLQKAGLISNKKLVNQLETRLSASGSNAWEVLKTFYPATEGSRTILARFPAMLELAARFSQVTAQGEYILLSTTLSERAAPNLLMASYLSWQHWGRAERTFFDEPTEPLETTSLTFEQRMQQPYEVDFRLTPLQEAFQMIGDEIGIRFTIDGDALKNEGYTQNMQQNFQEEKIPAKKALSLILGQYPKMVLVPDVNKMSVTVTTQAAAEGKGWAIYSLEPVQKQ